MCINSTINAELIPSSTPGAKAKLPTTNYLKRFVNCVRLPLKIPWDFA